MKSLTFGKQRSARTARRRAAFTLIELLVVIAIIAILAAIIFPVFAQVRENSRRSNTISNMQRIYSALRQYKLDNRTYPEYLFGPVLDKNGNIVTDASVSPNDVMSMNEIGAVLRAQTPASPPDEVLRVKRIKEFYKESLFPAYINDIAVFSCPDNVDVRTADNKSFAVVKRNVVTGRSTAVPSTVAFYKYDAFDASPAVTGPVTIDKNTFQARYSRLWFANGTKGDGSVQFFSGQSSPNDLGTLDDLRSNDPNKYNAYTRQLVFNNPSADTYVTMTTYHVPNTKICVLFLNGTAKVLDARKLTLVPGNNAVEKSSNANWLVPGS